MYKNFVTISGVSDRKQLDEINEICQEEDIQFPIAIGYQVSNKSINQGTQNSRQPRFKDLGELSKETLDYGFIPSIHYYTKNNETIVRDLCKIAGTVGDSFPTLIQFNTLPPSPEVLRKVKEMGFGIIFKVAVSNKQSSEKGYAVWKGDEVQDVEKGKVEPLVNQVQERKNFIDYVMFDPSHGTNLELNLGEDSLSITFGKDIAKRSELNHLGLIYAGGIKPTNVKSVTRSLLSFFPQERISIDVESGIREGGELNINSVKSYLTNYRLALS